MTLVFTAGVMDLLHEGHINLLRRMRQRGDMTLVVLHDGFTTFRNKRKLPIENLEKRTRNLIDTGLVDVVLYTFSESPEQEFCKIVERFGSRFGLVFMRGDDWKSFPGHAYIRGVGIPIEFVPYTAGVSTSRLRLDL